MSFYEKCLLYFFNTGLILQKDQITFSVCSMSYFIVYNSLLGRANPSKKQNWHSLATVSLAHKLYTKKETHKLMRSYILNTISKFTQQCFPTRVHIRFCHKNLRAINWLHFNNTQNTLTIVLIQFLIFNYKKMGF